MATVIKVRLTAEHSLRLHRAAMAKKKPVNTIMRELIEKHLSAVEMSLRSESPRESNFVPAILSNELARDFAEKRAALNCSAAELVGRILEREFSALAISANGALF